MRKGKIVSLVLGTTMTLSGIYGISRNSTTANIIGAAGCLAGVGLIAYSFSSRKRKEDGYSNNSSHEPSHNFLDWVFLDGLNTSDNNKSGFHGFGGGSFGGGAGGSWDSDDGDSGGDAGGGDDFKPPQRTQYSAPRMRSCRTKALSPRF